jgi:2-(1,2-epoxy-1,2-dihydrophenyl)acetyl-CoA isomerase
VNIDILNAAGHSKQLLSLSQRDIEMENYETVKYSVSNQVATIALNRPKQLNALNRQLTLELHEALKAAECDNEVRVIVLTGSGRAFCSGADLEDVQGPAPGVIEARINNEFLPVITAIYDMAKPVICAVNGPVAGVGGAFVLASDLAIMVEESYLYTAFNAIGLIPDGGISWLLHRQVGSKLAYQICIQNEKVPASRCLELGLINKVVPVNGLMDEARRWAKQIVEGAPLVPGELKKLFKNVPQMEFSESIRYEAKIQDRLAQTPDSRRLVAGFLQ